jgi:hypothetical protein
MTRYPDTLSDSSTTSRVVPGIGDVMAARRCAIEREGIAEELRNDRQWMQTPDCFVCTKVIEETALAGIRWSKDGQANAITEDFSTAMVPQMTVDAFTQLLDTLSHYTAMLGTVRDVDGE